MPISFSTINKDTAKEYLAHKSYSFLTAAAKEKAIEFCGEGVLRVQDPMMYPSPQLEIADREVYEKILKALEATP